MKRPVALFVVVAAAGLLAATIASAQPSRNLTLNSLLPSPDQPRELATALKLLGT